LLVQKLIKPKWEHTARARIHHINNPLAFYIGLGVYGMTARRRQGHSSATSNTQSGSAFVLRLLCETSGN
jgi:hypothetical protein